MPRVYAEEPGSLLFPAQAYSICMYGIPRAETLKN
jgi:hypothetical protein